MQYIPFNKYVKASEHNAEWTEFYFDSNHSVRLCFFSKIHSKKPEIRLTCLQDIQTQTEFLDFEKWKGNRYNAKWWLLAYIIASLLSKNWSRDDEIHSLRSHHFLRVHESHVHCYGSVCIVRTSSRSNSDSSLYVRPFFEIYYISECQ